MDIINPTAQMLSDFSGEIKKLGETERYWKLNAHESTWKGKQYSARPSWWDDEVPLRERAPSLNTHIAETCINKLTDLVFGNSRFPTLAVGDNDYGLEFSEQEQQFVAEFVQRIVAVAKLPSVMRRALQEGLGVGTAVVFLSFVKGKPCAKVIAAKYCEPTFESDELVSVEVSYLLQRGDQHVRYRRVIDRENDLVFHELPVRDVGVKPWIVDETRSFSHNLGFVPVVWHRNECEASDLSDIDGSPLFDGFADEIEGLDRSLSMTDRNALYNGEPQMIRTGVDNVAPIGEMGRTAVKSLAERLVGGANFARPESATKKAPGKVWNLPTGADAKLLESSGAGAQILQNNYEQIRRVLLEVKSIVIASPEVISANASAALMGELFAPMLAVADNLRESYGELLEAIVNLFLRMVLVLGKQGKKVFLAGVDVVQPILQRLSVPFGEEMLWVGVELALMWGDYFEPTPADLSAMISVAMSGNGGKPVLTHKQSIEMVLPLTKSKLTSEQVLAEINGSEVDNAAT